MTRQLSIRKVLAAVAATAALTAGMGAVASPAVSAAATQVATATDPFFTYTGSQPLSSYAPGTVLKTRTIPYHVIGIKTPVQAVQLLYRSTDAQGRAIANVTSVLKPAAGPKPAKAVAYNSFYDSLNPEDGPSRAIAGDVSFGGLIANVEAIFIVPLLLSGHTVIMADTQGPTADFAAGPEYGMATLDSVRAASTSTATGLSTSTKVGMIGYSGGAIATNWAATLAPTYAPDVNKNLIGATEGGLLVAPAHNLDYVSGSLVWAGIAPMAITGVGRAYGIDFTPYLSAYGKSLVDKMQKASIANVLGQYPGLTFKKLTKPEYADPNSIPEFVEIVNKLNLGSRGTPTIPMFIGQGTAGQLEGTSGLKPGIGSGDGVMIAGDVRTLARQYCSTGNTKIKHREYALTSHVGTAALWAPEALLWLNDRFAGKTAPSSCGTIRAGNSLAPEVVASN